MASHTVRVDSTLNDLMAEDVGPLFCIRQTNTFLKGRDHVFLHLSFNASFHTVFCLQNQVSKKKTACRVKSTPPVLLTSRAGNVWAGKCLLQSYFGNQAANSLQYHTVDGRNPAPPGM